MHRLFLLGSLLILAGCRNTAGPLQPQTPGRVDDPLLTIGEQERNGRARLSLPEESRLTPQISGMDQQNKYTPYGR